MTLITPPRGLSRCTASQLDRFQRFLDGKISEDRLVIELAGLAITSKHKWRGREFAAYIARRARTGVWPPSETFRWTTEQPWVPAEHETPIRLHLKTPAGKCVMRGYIDSVDNREHPPVLIDWKTSIKAAAEVDYASSWQWRVYLAARPDSDVFEYRHLRVREKWRGRGLRYWEIFDSETIMLAREPDIPEQVAERVHDFQRFVNNHEYLEITDQGRIRQMPVETC